MGTFGGKVAVIGTGAIKSGEDFHQSLTDMIYEAVTLALAVASGEEALGAVALKNRHHGSLNPRAPLPTVITAGMRARAPRVADPLPVNTSGGLKSRGHPIGSSGIRTIDNIHDQLTGRAGTMRVKGADMGLAHTLGGPGAVSAVAVLSQP